MFVQHQIICVAIQLLKAEGGSVTVVNFVHGRGEGLEGMEGGGGVHLTVGTEGFDGEGIIGSIIGVGAVRVGEGHFLFFWCWYLI